MKTGLVLIFLVANFLQVDAQDFYASLDKKTNKTSDRNISITTDVQYWEFNSALTDYQNHSFAKADKEIFGKEIACLLALLDEKYIRKEQIAIGDPVLQTNILKPVIYNSVKNLVRYYKQKSQNNTLSTTDCEQLTHIVKVALACPEEDTSDFEKALKKNRKDPDQQLDCFKRVRLTNIYE